MSERVDAIVSCSDLEIGYGGRAVASGISFSVTSGDCLCVIGENGTGKSTLLRTILGLQPPVSGKVQFASDIRPGDIGYLPQQNPVQGDFPATAREVVLSGYQSMRGWKPFFGAACRRAADDALKSFDAIDLARKPYRELSGGQRQRVLLARALCAGKKILVLDEPATGLDPEAAEDLYRALRTLRAKGLSSISVTHDLPAGIADATHVLELGEAPFFGAKAEWEEMRHRREEARHGHGA